MLTVGLTKTSRETKTTQHDATCASGIVVVGEMECVSSVADDEQLLRVMSNFGDKMPSKTSSFGQRSHSSHIGDWLCQVWCFSPGFFWALMNGCSSFFHGPNVESC